MRKPIGLYGCDHEPPPWASFAMVGDPAYLPSWRRPGFQWVAQIGFNESPLEPAGLAARRARRGFEAAGVWDDVIAFAYGEEWYARFDAGEFTRYGLPPDHPHGVEIIRRHVSRQHAEIVRETGRPVVWVAPEVSATRQPPDGTSYVLIDRYPLDGEDAMAYATSIVANEAATPLPLVLVPRWYRCSGAGQGPSWHLLQAEPSRASIEITARILARPRWVAAVGFLWASRPWADLVGMADMPDVTAAVEELLIG